MIIRANGKDIAVKSVISEKMKRNGNSYPALRFEFEDSVSAEDVTALLCGTFDILDDEGNVVGTHEGYTTKGSISLVVGRVTTSDERVVELENALAATQAEKEELQEAMNVIVGGEA